MYLTNKPIIFSSFRVFTSNTIIGKLDNLKVKSI